MSSKFFGNKHDNKTQEQNGKPTVQNKSNNTKQTQVKKSGRGK
jgi:hypothetical protein